MIRDDGPHLQTALIAFKGVNLYGHFIQRSSITTAVVVNRRSQFQKQRYIFRESYIPLGRDVLRLKQLCGLHFKKRFSNVPAGNYQISLHIQLRGELDYPGRPRRWNNNCTTRLAVIDEDADSFDSLLVNVDIEPDYWKQIQKEKFDNNALSGNAHIVREHNSLQVDNWFFIVLKPFYLLLECLTALAVLVYLDKRIVILVFYASAFIFQ